MAQYNFKDSQFLAVSPEELFKFFMQPQNLTKIMASAMEVKVRSSSTPILEKGTVIDYTFKKNGFPLSWQSKIIEYEENEYFVDLQVKGPFKYWHHRHILKPVANGTEVIDDLTFEPPFGFLGRIAYHLFIKRQIASIFESRKLSMEKIFPTR